MICGRSEQVRQGLRPPPSTLARRRNDLPQHQRNITEKIGARVKGQSPSNQEGTHD